MTSFCDLPVKKVIALYNEKLNAVDNGNLNWLLMLKKNYPELFIKENEDRICEIIEYATNFQSTPRYKEIKEKLDKQKLTLIGNK